MTGHMTKTVDGVVFSDMNNRNTTFNADQIADHIFEIGNLHIGDQEQIRHWT